MFFCNILQRFLLIIFKIISYLFNILDKMHIIPHPYGNNTLNAYFFDIFLTMRVHQRRKRNIFLPKNNLQK